MQGVTALGGSGRPTRIPCFCFKKLESGLIGPIACRSHIDGSLDTGTHTRSGTWRRSENRTYIWVNYNDEALT